MSAADKIRAGTTRIPIFDEPEPSHADGEIDGVKAFAAHRLDEMPDEAQDEIVQRLYGRRHCIAFVGSPNAGKTALAVDHLLHVTANAAWFDLKVAGGPVVYFAPEAPASVTMRAKAAIQRKFAGRKLAFYVVRDTPQIGDENYSTADAERMIATIRAVSAKENNAVRVIAIDTLASCLGGGDENSDGMIRLVAAAKHIAASTDCAVIIVHHPSKGDGAGLRGHGSLAAACDAILSITTDDVSGIRTATLTKSRDSATGLQLCYELEPVTLPTPDAFGDARTTIVVKPATVTQRKPRPSGARQQALLAELERRHRTGETSWDEATAREAGRQIGIPKTSLHDAVKGLIRAGYLYGATSRLTLKYPPEAQA